MIELDLSLKDLKIPGITGYTPEFGTKKPDGESLTTAEVNKNIMLPFESQRAIVVEGSEQVYKIKNVDNYVEKIFYTTDF